MSMAMMIPKQIRAVILCEYDTAAANTVAAAAPASSTKAMVCFTAHRHVDITKSPKVITMGPGRAAA